MLLFGVLVLFLSFLVSEVLNISIVYLASACIAAFVLGAVSVLTLRVIASPKHESNVKLPGFISQYQEAVQGESSTLHKNETSPSKSRSPAIISRSVSSTLQNLLDLIFRDVVEPQLRDIILDNADGTSLLRKGIWEVMYRLVGRFSHIDSVQFVAQDIVTRITIHMEKIRLSQQTPDVKDRTVPYCVKSFLLDQQTELSFLRKLSEVSVMLLFPKPYVDYLPLRHLIRELLACQVFQPVIDLITDPDTINQQIVLNLRSRQALKRDYAYTQSYEDFATLIELCDDLQELQQIRANIMTEIAQATAISTMKKAKGIEIDQEFLPQGNRKGDLLQARNLKRYLKELTYAKLQCDRRLRSMGVSVNEINRSNPVDKSIEEMIPTFKTVMRNSQLRQQLGVYLQQQGHAHLALLEFWLAVQEMRKANRSGALQIASKIFFAYLHGTSPQIKIEKGILKGVEAFLSGDKGPEAFYQAQDYVWKILEDRHYPSFLVVLTCKMTGRTNQSETSETDSSAWNACSSPGIAETNEESVEWSEQMLLAKNRLENLEPKLNLKLQSLTNLRKFAPADCALIVSLEKEIETLQSEKIELETWQSQAETWAAHLGYWKTTIILPQNLDDKDCVRFAIEIHLDEENSPVKNVKHSLTSWTVWRQVAEFYALHSKLSQNCSWLKSAQLPALSGKTLFGKVNEKVYLEKAQEKLQLFLDVVMVDEVLNKTEALFTFLHNTPACLRPLANVPKKSRFFLATLFKSDTPRESDDDTEVEGLVPTADENDGGLLNFSDDARDAIAEPIYLLLGEVFELRGVFGWLRRTLVTFVQITYGRTINKQLRETISSLFTDQAVISYIQVVVKTYWPDGSLSPAPQPRTEEEKRKTKQEAKDLLLSSIPDVLCQLLGQQNARKGILKVFNALQDQRLNKQLFYDIAEVVIKDIYPEVVTPRY